MGNSVSISRCISIRTVFYIQTIGSRSIMKLAWTVALMLVILSIQVDARSFQKVGTEESTRGLVQIKKVLMDQLSKIQTQSKISSEAGDPVQEKENRKCSLIQLIFGCKN